jgi:hypothetical protein
VVGVLFFTVVGVVGLAVVGVVGTVVVGESSLWVVDVVGVVVVVLARGVDGTVVLDVGGVVTVVVLAAFASAATRTADSAHDPRTINCVKRRTRAKRRSRCWGVRFMGTIGILSLQSRSGC